MASTATVSTDQPWLGTTAARDGRRGLFLGDGTRLPAPVVTTVTAHGVRQLGLLALRTRARAHGLERVVRAALGGTGLRVAAFWIRHGTRSVVIGALGPPG